MVAIPSSIVYSVVTPIQEATSLVLDDLNLGTGVMCECCEQQVLAVELIES